MAIQSADTLARIKLNFPLTFSFVGAIGLFGLTAWFAYDTRSVKDTLIFFLAGGAAVGQLTASIYTARMLAATLAIRSDDINLRARAYAMQFGARFNDPAFFRVRDAIREVLNHQGSHETVMQLCDEHQTDIINMFNFLEELATAFEKKMVDPVLTRRQFSGVVTGTWAKAWPWIQCHRIRRGQPDLWEDLERLYDGWKRKL